MATSHAGLSSEACCWGLPACHHTWEYSLTAIDDTDDTVHLHMSASRYGLASPIAVSTGMAQGAVHNGKGGAVRGRPPGSGTKQKEGHDSVRAPHQGI